MDGLLSGAQETFVPGERDKVLAASHELIVDQAAWLWMVHDLNLHAMSTKVKAFKPPQSWFQDFTNIFIDQAWSVALNLRVMDTAQESASGHDGKASPAKLNDRFLG